MKNEDRVYGPYTRRDGRQHVVHINKNGKKRTQSYPRYLLEQALGIILSALDDVHHKDEDFSNNELSNLEIKNHILHSQEHGEKNAKWFYFNCPICNTPTRKPLHKVRNNLKQGKKGPYCSKRCAGIASHHI